MRIHRCRNLQTLESTNKGTHRHGNPKILYPTDMGAHRNPQALDPTGTNPQMQNPHSHRNPQMWDPTHSYHTHTGPYIHNYPTHIGPTPKSWLAALKDASQFLWCGRGDRKGPGVTGHQSKPAKDQDLVSP